MKLENDENCVSYIICKYIIVRRRSVYAILIHASYGALGLIVQCSEISIAFTR